MRESPTCESDLNVCKHLSGCLCVSPYWIHALQYALAVFLPFWLHGRIVYGELQAVRKQTAKLS
eukprot:m.732511 g.732511  ORF g.732511 m.732511 type:complete len:64 (+) comp23068_c0_seq6:1412-1603(+)